MSQYLMKLIKRSVVITIVAVLCLNVVNARAADKVSAAAPPTSKEFTVTEKYLIMPIDNNGKNTYIHLFINNMEVRRYELKLAAFAQAADWYAYFTIENYIGKEARVTVDNINAEGFALVKQSAAIPGEENFYKEAHRPQFHFTQKVGWNNDANGMVYYNGKYHLFFQHNPVDINWGNITWGHATSTDLLHWEQQPNALFPYIMARGICASGSATVDKLNTAGWGSNTLVAFFTDNRTPNHGESIAYSTDNGNTFTYYKDSPFLKHQGRDPKVFWYEYDANDTPLNDTAKELGGHWVMAVFDETGTLEIKWGPRYIQFYSSTNMKDWTYQGHLLGYFECPELFELPVDGGTNGTKWVIFGANSEYQIGEFDGRTFTPDHTDKYRVHYGKYYAAQTFDNTPDGRRIQMGWVKISSPGPYNQHFSVPHCNTLRTTKDGIRMFAEPIEEISKLRKKTDTLSAQLLPDGVSRSLSVSGKLFDIRATFKVGNADKVAISMDGATIIYDAKSRTLNDNPLEPVDGKISIQALIDNSIMEIVGNDGRIFITEPHTYQGTVNEIKITANGGDADLIKFEAHELNSIWGN